MKHGNVKLFAVFALGLLANVAYLKSAIDSNYLGAWFSFIVANASAI